MDYLAKITSELADERTASVVNEVWQCSLKLGLSTREVAVLCSLLIKGPLSVRELSENLDMHPVAVHGVLRKLSAAGMVDIILGTPTRYVAKGPDELVKVLWEKQVNQMKAAQAYSERLKDELALLVERTPVGIARTTPRGPRYRVIAGRRRLHKEIAQLLEGTQRSHHLIMSSYGIKRSIAHGLIDRYKECVARGVEMKVIADVSPMNILEASYLAKVVELRHLSNIQMRLNISDSRAMILGAVSQDEDLTLSPTNEIHFIIYDEFLCGAFERLFAELWKNSTPAGQIIELIEKSQTK